jgi:hypothetical protein
MQAGGAALPSNVRAILQWPLHVLRPVAGPLKVVVVGGRGLSSGFRRDGFEAS